MGWLRAFLSIAQIPTRILSGGQFSISSSVLAAGIGMLAFFFLGLCTSFRGESVWVYPEGESACLPREGADTEEREAAPSLIGWIDFVCSDWLGGDDFHDVVQPGFLRFGIRWRTLHRMNLHHRARRCGADSDGSVCGASEAADALTLPELHELVFHS